MTLVAVLRMRVVPAPFCAPPVQSKLSLTSTTPVPLSVPALCARRGVLIGVALASTSVPPRTAMLSVTLTVPLKVATPPLLRSCGTLTGVVALKVGLPPVSAIVGSP